MTTISLDPPILKQANVIQIKSRICKSGRMAHSPILVDATLREVECGTCGEKLTPINVLVELSTAESRWNWRIRELTEYAEKVKLKTRTKCECCGKMTRIRK